VIHLHEKKIHAAMYKMMKFFGVKGKHAFEFEKSDMLFYKCYKRQMSLFFLHLNINSLVFLYKDLYKKFQEKISRKFSNSYV
jgi:hypothetical protein